MRCEYLVTSLSVAALIVLAPVAAIGQDTRGWTAPKTPWGDPDLQGTFTNKTITPVQRPDELAGRDFLTEEEIATLERQIVERNERLLVRPALRTTAGNVDRGVDGAPGAYNNFWLDGGTRPTGRTSLIVDPPNGKIPPVTPAFDRVAAARAEARLTRGPADAWEDFQLNDRCIVWSAGPPMMPGPYNNTYMIFQTPDYVAIQVEMIHDTRIIPLDGRPHLDPLIRQSLGDMRGHWEGDTLVVETTNIARTEGDPGVQGADEIELRAANGRSDDTIRVIERFTRVDTDTIQYEFTIEDPSRWTRSFSGEFPFVTTDGRLYEYACHEGNYSMPTILRGERVQDNLAASK
jgi:hypothetical protein